MKNSLKLSALAVLLMAVQVCWSATKPVKTAAAKTKKPAAASTVAKKKAAAAEADFTAVDSTEAATAEQPEKKEPTADDYRRQGDLAAKKGQIEKAMEAYRKCLELSSEDDSANGRIFLSLGKYCFEKKEYEEALNYFSKARGRATERLAFKKMLAEALQLTGNNDSAIAVLAPFAANPKLVVKLNRDMFKVLGDACYAIDSLDNAVKWYAKYLRLGGTQTADMAYLMASSQEKTSIAKAKLAYQANIKRYPKDYRNFVSLGKLNAKNRATLQSALGLLKKAAQIADTIPSIWLEIGKVYGSLGQRDDELEAYRTCLRGDADNLEVLLRIGSALLDRGSAGDAVTYLEKAHKLVPDNAKPMAALSAAYIKSGNSQKAIELLTKLKTVQPKNIEARKQLIVAYKTTNQEQKAIEEINAALEVERDYELLLAGGTLLVKQGEFDDAVVMLEEVLGIMPENIDALMILARAKRGQQKLEEAIEIYKEVVVYDPKYAPALYERAEVHLEQDKVKWAEMFYQRALDADPKFALAEVGLAKVSKLYKKRDEYYGHLRKAEALAPNDPVVQREIEKVRNPSKVKTGSAANVSAGGDNENSDDENADSGDDSEKKGRRRRKR